MSIEEQDGMSSIRLHVIMIEEVVLKQDVFILLLRETLISQSIQMIQILHAHLSNMIIFRLVEYPRSCDRLSR
jgi:hypothetical protein